MSGDALVSGAEFDRALNLVSSEMSSTTEERGAAGAFGLPDTDRDGSIIDLEDLYRAATLTSTTEVGLISEDIFETLGQLEPLERQSFRIDGSIRTSW